MAKNVINYVSNISRSVAYSTVDHFKKNNETLTQFADMNKELGTILYNSVKDFKGTTAKGIDYVKNSAVGEAAFEFKKALFEDIASGNFYNKERIKKMESKAAGSLADFSDLDGFDDLDNMFKDSDDDIFVDSSEENIKIDSIGEDDIFLSDSINEVGAETSKAINMGTAKSAEYIIKANKKYSLDSMKHNEVLFGKLNVGIGALNSNIGSIIEFNNEVMKIHVENSSKFFTDTTDKLKTTNELLAQIIENQNKLTSSNQRNSSSSNSIDYDDITSSGAPDLMEYFKKVKSNAKSMSGGVADLTNIFEDGNILLTFAGSPLKLITDKLVQTVIPKSLDKTMNQFNKSLEGYFGSTIMKLNQMANSDEANPILKGIGKLLGIEMYPKSTIDTAAYNKGPIPWDGQAKKSLTEVIPAQLAEIISILSGKPSKLYDFDTGKFVSSDQLQKTMADREKSNQLSASQDIRDELNKMMEYFNGSKSDIDSLKKDIENMFIQNFKDGSLLDYRRKSASDLGISNDTNLQYIKAMLDSLPRNMMMRYNNELLSSISRHNKDMRDKERSGAAGIEYFKYNNYFDKDTTLKNNSSKSSSLTTAYENRNILANAKDKHGRDTFYYMQNIYKELIWQRQNWLVGGVPQQPSHNRYNRRANLYQSIQPKLTSIDSINIQDNRDISLKQREKYREEARYEEQRERKINKSKDNNTHLLDMDVINSQYSENVDLYKAIKNSISRNRDKFEHRLNSLDRESNSEDMTIFRKIAKKGSFSEKTQDILFGLDKLSKKPVEFLSNLLHKADERMYELLYGSEFEKMDKPRSFMGNLMYNLRMTFTDFRTWMTDNVFDPLSEKFLPMLDSVLDKFGLDRKSAGKNIKNFLFGERDEEGKLINPGLFGKAIDYVENSFKDVYKPVKDYIEGDAKDVKGIIMDSNKDASEESIDKFINRVPHNVFKTDDELKEAYNNFHAKEKIAEAVDKKSEQVRSRIEKGKGTVIKDILKDENGNIVRDEDGNIKKVERKNDGKKSHRTAFNHYQDRFTERLRELAAKGEEDPENKLYKFAAQKLKEREENPDTIARFNKGTPLITKTGIAAVSEGEAIIPAHLNPFNENRDKADVEKASAEENKKIKKFKELFKSYSENIEDKKIFGFATGTASVKVDEEEGTITDDNVYSFEDDIKRRQNKSKKKRKRERKSSSSDSEAAPPDGEEDNNLYRIGKKYYRKGHELYSYKVADELSNGIKAVFNTLIGTGTSLKERVLGKIEDASEISEEEKKELLHGVIDDVKSNGLKKYLPAGLGGAILGGGVSLITGAIGGPLLGAAVGAGISINQESEAVQNWLFGKRDSEGKRTGNVIGRELSRNIDKYFPDMAKGAVVGGITSILPFVPGGPVAGIILGSSIGFAKNNQRVLDSLFGTMDENGERQNDGIIKQTLIKQVKTALPRMGAGAVAGLFAGPFGIVGNMMLGSAIGYATTNEKFREAILGTETEDGKREGGLLGAIKNGVVDPLVDFTKDSIGFLKKWFKDDVINPVTSAIKPIAKQIAVAAGSLFFGAEKILDRIIEKKIGIPLGTFFSEKILKPLTKTSLSITKLLMRPAAYVASAPTRLIGKVGNRLRRRQIANGNADYMTASERLEFREQEEEKAKNRKTKIPLLGAVGYVGNRLVNGKIKKDKLKRFDEILASSDTNQLEELKSAFNMISTPNATALDEKNKAISELNRKVTNGYGLDYAQSKKILKKVKDRDLKGLKSYIDNNIFFGDDYSKKEQFTRDLNLYMTKAHEAEDNYYNRHKVKEIYSEKLKQLGLGNLDLNDKRSVQKYKNLIEKEINNKSIDEVIEDNNKERHQELMDVLKQGISYLKEIADPEYKEKMKKFRAKYNAHELNKHKSIFRSGGSRGLYSNLSEEEIERYREEGIWDGEDGLEGEAANTETADLFENRAARGIVNRLRRSKTARIASNIGRRLTGQHLFGRIESNEWDEASSVRNGNYFRSTKSMKEEYLYNKYMEILSSGQPLENARIDYSDAPAYLKKRNGQFDFDPKLDEKVRKKVQNDYDNKHKGIRDQVKNAVKNKNISFGTAGVRVSKVGHKIKTAAESAFNNDENNEENPNQQQRRRKNLDYFVDGDGNIHNYEQYTSEKRAERKKRKAEKRNVKDNNTSSFKDQVRDSIDNAVNTATNNISENVEEILEDINEATDESTESSSNKKKKRNGISKRLSIKVNNNHNSSSGTSEEKQEEEDKKENDYSDSINSEDGSESNKNNKSKFKWITTMHGRKRYVRDSKSGEYEEDESDSETKETNDAQEEERSTMKLVKDSLIGIGSTIKDGFNRIFGIDEEQDSWRKKLLKIALGVAGGLTALGGVARLDKWWNTTALPSISQFLQPIAPMIATSATSIAVGLDNIVTAIPSKIESLIGNIKYGITQIPIFFDKYVVPLWNEGLDWLMDKAIPGAVELFVTIIPQLASAIGKGVWNALNSNIDNTLNLNDRKKSSTDYAGDFSELTSLNGSSYGTYKPSNTTDSGPFVKALQSIGLYDASADPNASANALDSYGNPITNSSANSSSSGVSVTATETLQKGLNSIKTRLQEGSVTAGDIDAVIGGYGTEGQSASELLTESEYMAGDTYDTNVDTSLQQTVSETINQSTQSAQPTTTQTQTTPTVSQYTQSSSSNSGYAEAYNRYTQTNKTLYSDYVTDQSQISQIQTTSMDMPSTYYEFVDNGGFDTYGANTQQEQQNSTAVKITENIQKAITGTGVQNFPNMIALNNENIGSSASAFYTVDENNLLSYKTESGIGYVKDTTGSAVRVQNITLDSNGQYLVASSTGLPLIDNNGNYIAKSRLVERDGKLAIVLEGDSLSTVDSPYQTQSDSYSTDSSGNTSTTNSSSNFLKNPEQRITKYYSYSRYIDGKKTYYTEEEALSKAVYKDDNSGVVYNSNGEPIYGVYYDPVANTFVTNINDNVKEAYGEDGYSGTNPYGDIIDDNDSVGEDKDFFDTKLGKYSKMLGRNIVTSGRAYNNKLNRYLTNRAIKSGKGGLIRKTLRKTSNFLNLGIINAGDAAANLFNDTESKIMSSYYKSKADKSLLGKVYDKIRGENTKLDFIEKYATGEAKDATIKAYNKELKKAEKEVIKEVTGGKKKRATQLTLDESKQVKEKLSEKMYSMATDPETSDTFYQTLKDSANEAIGTKENIEKAGFDLSDRSRNTIVNETIDDVVTDTTLKSGKKVTKKGVKNKVVNKIKDSALKVTQAKNTVKKKVVDKAASTALGKGVKKIQSSISDAVLKVLKSNKVKKLLKKVGIDDISGLKDTIQKLMGKLFDKAIEKTGMSSVAKGVKNFLGKYAGPIAWGLTAADFLSGFFKAKSIMQIADPNFVERIICGLINLLYNKLPIFIQLVTSEKVLFELYLKILKVTPWFKDYAIKIEQKQNELRNEVAQYNANNNENLSIEEYLEKDSLWGKTKKAFSNAMKSAGQFFTGSKVTDEEYNTYLEDHKDKTSSAASLRALSDEEISSMSDEDKEAYVTQWNKDHGTNLTSFEEVQEALKKSDENATKKADDYKKDNTKTGLVTTIGKGLSSLGKGIVNAFKPTEVKAATTTEAQKSAALEKKKQEKILSTKEERNNASEKLLKKYKKQGKKITSEEALRIFEESDGQYDLTTSGALLRGMSDEDISKLTADEKVRFISQWNTEHGTSYNTFEEILEAFYMSESEQKQYKSIMADKAKEKSSNSSQVTTQKGAIERTKELLTSIADKARKNLEKVDEDSDTALGKFNRNMGRLLGFHDDEGNPLSITEMAKSTLDAKNPSEAMYYLSQLSTLSGGILGAIANTAGKWFAKGWKGIKNFFKENNPVAWLRKKTGTDDSEIETVDVASETVSAASKYKNSDTDTTSYDDASVDNLISTTSKYTKASTINYGSNYKSTNSGFYRSNLPSAMGSGIRHRKTPRRVPIGVRSGGGLLASKPTIQNYNFESKRRGGLLSGAGSGIIPYSKRKLSGGSSKPTWKDYLHENLGSWSTPTVEEMNAWIKKKRSDSPFNGHGDIFIKAGQLSGLDPRYLLAHAALESAWGTSRICKDKNNYFGIGAFDASPYSSAYSFGSGLESGICGGALWIRENYYDKHAQRTIYLMIHDPNGSHNYATDPQWANQIAQIMQHGPVNTKLVKDSSSALATSSSSTISTDSSSSSSTEKKSNNWVTQLFSDISDAALAFMGLYDPEQTSEDTSSTTTTDDTSSTTGDLGTSSSDYITSTSSSSSNNKNNKNKKSPFINKKVNTTNKTTYIKNTKKYNPYTPTKSNSTTNKGTSINNNINQKKSQTGTLWTNYLLKKQAQQSKNTGGIIKNGGLLMSAKGSEIHEDNKLYLSEKYRSEKENAELYKDLIKEYSNDNTISNSKRRELIRKLNNHNNRKSLYENKYLRYIEDDKVPESAGSSFISQLDPQYALDKFGDSTIGEQGCGPATATMALQDLGANISMDEASNLALSYKDQNGTQVSYFKDIFEKYGAKVNYNETKDGILNDLKDGKSVVLMGQDSFNTSKDRSPYGPGAHYVLASGLDENGNIIVKDPEQNSEAVYNKNILNKTSVGVAVTDPETYSESASGSGIANKIISAGASKSKDNDISSADFKFNKDSINYIKNQFGTDLKELASAWSGVDATSSSSSSTTTGSTGSKGEQVVQIARSYMGKVKYVFGAASPDSGRSDCSGFTQHCYKKIGITIGRDTHTQSTKGQEISKSDLQLGDLVFFQGTYRSGVSHVGIYSGNGNFIHCSSSKGVIESSLNSSYWKSHWYKAKRVINTSSASGSGVKLDNAIHKRTTKKNIKSNNRKVTSAGNSYITDEGVDLYEGEQENIVTNNTKTANSNNINNTTNSILLNMTKILQKIADNSDQMTAVINLLTQLVANTNLGSVSKNKSAKGSNSKKTTETSERGASKQVQSLVTKYTNSNQDNISALISSIEDLIMNPN